MEIGVFHELTIVKERDQGLYLTDDLGDEVLLPNKYVPESFEFGDTLRVFVYLDHSEREVATTLEPYVTVNKFALLKCVSTTEFGGFLDWGLEKNLFIPFKEQVIKVRKGEWYLVHVFKDEKTNRLLASSKTNRFLNNNNITLKAYDKVEVIASHPSDKGWNVIVDQKYSGLVYHDEIFQKISVGDVITAYVKKVRRDNKIDITLQQHGYRSIDPNADIIVNLLNAEGGFLPLTDKSTPQKIQEILQMSKKNFKKAVGFLYKKRKIVLDTDGIRLRNPNS